MQCRDTIKFVSMAAYSPTQGAFSPATTVAGGRSPEPGRAYSPTEGAYSPATTVAYSPSRPSYSPATAGGRSPPPQDYYGAGYIAPPIMQPTAPPAYMAQPPPMDPYRVSYTPQQVTGGGPPMMAGSVAPLAPSVASASTSRRAAGVSPQDIKRALYRVQEALRLPDWTVYPPKDALVTMAFRPPPMDLQVLIAGPTDDVATALWLAPDEALGQRDGCQPRGCGGQCPWTQIRAAWTVRDVRDVPLPGSKARRMPSDVQKGMVVSMAPRISGGTVKPHVLVSTHALRGIIGIVRMVAAAFADAVPAQ